MAQYYSASFKTPELNILYIWAMLPHSVLSKAIATSHLPHNYAAFSFMGEYVRQKVVQQKLCVIASALIARCLSSMFH